MTKDKTDVVDKLINYRNRAASGVCKSGRWPGVQGDRFEYCDQRQGPVHGLNWCTQALNSTSLFATF
jgi:hypothetical protein